MVETEAQLQAAIKAAYDAVSNDPLIDPATARQTLANSIGAAVNEFVTANGGASVANLTTVKDGVVDLINELKKLKVDIGNNLDTSVLNTIETALESI